LTKHVQSEDAYAKAAFKALGVSAIAEGVCLEMRERLCDTETASLPNGSWSYYARQEKTATALSFLRFPTGADKSQAQVYFDVAEESRLAGVPLDLGSIEISDDEKLVMVTLDGTGSEIYNFQVRRLSDGVIVCEGDNVGVDTNEDVRPIFNAQSNGVFYIRRDAVERNVSISYREFSVEDENLGWVSEERTIFSESDLLFSVSLEISRDRKWVILDSSSGSTSEIYLIDRDNPLVPPVSLFGRHNGLMCQRVDVFDDQVLILSDLQSRDNGVIVGGGEYGLFVSTIELDHKVVMESRTALCPVDSWMESLVLPKGVILCDFEMSNGFTAFDTRVEGISRVMTARRKKNGQHKSPVFVGTPKPFTGQMLERDHAPFSRTVRITEKGMHPDHTFEAVINLRNPLFPLVSQYRLIHSEVIPGLDPDKYLGKMLHATSDDGIQVPVVVWTPRDVPVIGSVLTVYGAYACADEIEYSSGWQSLLDHGVACSVVYARGGGELGQAWYNAGNLDKKLTTMKDTVAGARVLSENGLAGIDGKRIILRGGSAGGAAVGGAVNLAPEIFSGVIAEVPFVDCLATMLDPTLPLTITEYEEWGNPTANKKDWEAIRSWAPLENIDPKKQYPPILATAGLQDPRVGIWEPARWVLALRKNNVQAYLKSNAGAGHGEAPDKFVEIAEAAELVAFALWCLSNK
jgi:oligopeptidase B